VSDKTNPWNVIEEPKVEVESGPMDGEMVTHPAFGQISASRISGHANLYGSDFSHHNFIEISISHSQLNRSLSRDLSFGRGEIVSVWLSEAQWATFVSSMNTGGTQCTLRHINREPIPMLPNPKSRTDQFSKEARQTTERAENELKELRQLIEASSLSGVKKKEFIRKIESASRAIGSSVGFVLDSFGEHMETTKEKAKIEIEAYLQSRIQRAGLEALANGNLIELTHESRTPKT
jgi:hypothetical protein